MTGGSADSKQQPAVLGCSVAVRGRLLQAPSLTVQNLSSAAGDLTSTAFPLSVKQTMKQHCGLGGSPSVMPLPSMTTLPRSVRGGRLKTADARSTDACEAATKLIHTDRGSAARHISGGAAPPQIEYKYQLGQQGNAEPSPHTASTLQPQRAENCNGRAAEMGDTTMLMKVQCDLPHASDLSAAARNFKIGDVQGSASKKGSQLQGFKPRLDLAEDLAAGGLPSTTVSLRVANSPLLEAVETISVEPTTEVPTARPRQQCVQVAVPVHGLAGVTGAATQATLPLPRLAAVRASELRSISAMLKSLALPGAAQVIGECIQNLMCYGTCI